MPACFLGFCERNAERVTTTSSYQRRVDLPGVEMLHFDAGSSAWQCYVTAYELVVPVSWAGDVWYRRKKHTLAPGSVLCPQLGEVQKSVSVHRPGALRSLLIDPDVLREHFLELGYPAARAGAWLRDLAFVSERLSARLNATFEALQPGSTLLQAESSLLSLVETIAAELTGQAPPDRDTDAGPAIARSIRELIDGDLSANLNVSDFAAQTRLSRFRVLRAFKQHYGLPPHTYQLCARLAAAQRSLRAGRSAAEVATHYGFVDQSHFTRHFRRVVGLTPLQYVNAGSPPRAGRKSSLWRQADAETTSSRPNDCTP